MIDPSEVRVVVEERGPRKPRQMWWGLTATLMGISYAVVSIPAVGHGMWQERRDEALRIIYAACAGAAIGFTIELARDQRSGRLSFRSFGLKSFLLFCYVAAVAIYIANGVLMLQSLR